MCGWRLTGLLAVCITMLIGDQGRAEMDYSKMKKDQVIAAFKVENIYENENGKAIGGRLRHIPSGFILDLLQIQSVPQAFLWVNSFPPSDQGEPHTCEHLMLGKGTKGRYVASLEEMYLGNSSAFTDQLKTCYHYHTAAGTDAFFVLMEAKLDALVHPNFSDEEIRREVCNVGYAIDPADSSISLEEKGTVYNEMVSSYERPWSNLGRELGYLLYGKNHPLSNESGGYPDDIRTMVPDDMRRFIDKNYHLSNMGMIVSIGSEIDARDCLKKLSEILSRVEPDTKPGPDPALADRNLPIPKPAHYGEIKIVGFPSQNEKEPGLLVFAWPPTLDFDNNEGYILDLLMSNLAGGETSNLFRKFIDSQSRVMNIGANAVFTWTSSDIGHAIYLGFNNVRRETCNEATIDTIRGEILKEIRRISELPDNSQELISFNERAKNLIIERRRDLRNFLNTPPGFGYRGTGSRWPDHLKHLQSESGFSKRLTLDEELRYAEKLLSGGKNFWRDYIQKWQLLVDEPYAVASCPDSKMLQDTETARKNRIATFIENLKAQYRVSENDDAVERFKEDYDKKTAEIDLEANKIAMPKFVDNPPLTLDDQLHYAVEKLPGGRQMVSSTFDNMTGAMTGLAFDMNVVPESLLIYVAALPTLLTEVGVTRGRLYSFDEMKEAIRQEIMELNSYYSVNARTQRVELVVRGEGGNLEESRKSLEWIEAVLFEPNWDESNLPRIRDAVDMTLSYLRNTMRAPEEAWVDDPAIAYWRQGNPLFLNANCFLTQTHSLQRLRWLLKDAGSAENSDAFSMFMKKFAVAGETTGRENLLRLLENLQNGKADDDTSSGYSELISIYRALPEKAAALALDAIDDLKQNLSDIPDATLAQDWRYLCREIESDLQILPAKALEDLKYTMSLILRSDNVRVFQISDAENRKALGKSLEKILSKLPNQPSQYQNYSAEPLVIDHLKERSHSSEKPIFVGLVNDNTRSGVFINSAPCASFEDSDPETLTKFLAARLYGGGGAHSMFMKTWSAGLAYSNGLRSNELTGRLTYYAERCPDLAQTMQFVVNELKNAPYDSSLTEYAVAQAFSAYRSGSRYETRGEAMAADFVDDLTPDKVRQFRQAVLDLRKDPNLSDKLHGIMEDTYGMVLPGYGPRADQVTDAIYFIIGPEQQFRSYEEYLCGVEGDFKLYRLYPRDFWYTKPTAPISIEPE